MSSCTQSDPRSVQPENTTTTTTTTSIVTIIFSLKHIDYSDDVFDLGMPRWPVSWQCWPRFDPLTSIMTTLAVRPLRGKGVDLLTLLGFPFSCRRLSKRLTRENQRPIWTEEYNNVLVCHSNFGPNRLVIQNKILGFLFLYSHEIGNLRSV